MPDKHQEQPRHRRETTARRCGQPGPGFLAEGRPRLGGGGTVV